MNQTFNKQIPKQNKLTFAKGIKTNPPKKQKEF